MTPEANVLAQGLTYLLNRFGVNVIITAKTGYAAGSVTQTSSTRKGFVSSVSDQQAALRVPMQEGKAAPRWRIQFLGAIAIDEESTLRFADKAGTSQEASVVKVVIDPTGATTSVLCA